MRFEAILELALGRPVRAGGVKDCRAALLRLAEAAQSYVGEGQSKVLRAALIDAENALIAAYDKGRWVSIFRINKDVLSEFIKAIRGNAWLLEEISARYLELHKSECWLLYEESKIKARVINDLLSLMIAPDVVVSKETSASIHEMVRLVRDQLSQLPYPPDYKVSTRWAETLQRSIRLATALRDARHIAYASLAIFDLPLTVLSNDTKGTLAHRCEHTYYRNHPELRGIGDSPLARPGTTVMMDGAPYSSKTEQGFFFYREIFTALIKDEPTDVVVEIGSGFGRLARIMHLAGRTKCYVLVDLPESLLFCYAFLKLSFPHARTHIVKSPDDVTLGMTSAYEFIFCPVQLLGELQLGPVDLVINTYSLSEMTQGCADFLMRCIHNVLQPKYLYSLNVMFTQKALHFSTGGLDGEANEIVLNVKPIWQPIRFDLTPAIDGENYSISGSAVLKNVSGIRAEQLICTLLDKAAKFDRGSPQWLGHMYLATLWGKDSQTREDFFGGLQQYLANQAITARPEYNFDEIGEVRYLRARTV